MVTSTCLRSILLMTALFVPMHHCYGPIASASTQRRTTTPFPPGVQPENYDNYGPESNSIAPEPQQPISKSDNSAGAPWWAAQKPVDSPAPCSSSTTTCTYKPVVSYSNSLSQANSRPESAPGVAIQPDNPWLSGLVQQNSLPSPSIQKPTSCGYGGCAQAPGPIPADNNLPTPSVSCTGVGNICVPNYLCRNGVVVQDGSGIFSSRSGSTKCNNGEVCCHLQKENTIDYQQQPSNEPTQPDYEPYQKPDYSPGQNGIPIGGSIYDTFPNPKPSQPTRPTPGYPQPPRPSYEPQPQPQPQPQNPQPTFSQPQPRPQPQRPTPGYPQPRPQPQNPQPTYSQPQPQNPQPTYSQPQPQNPQPTYSQPQPSLQPTFSQPQPQRPTLGYPQPQRPGNNYGFQPRPQGPSGSANDVNPIFNSPQFTNSRPTTTYTTAGPFRPYTGPLNTTPHPGCAAALKCVEEIYCTAEGVMADTPVYLTREQAENRVPLSECQNIETGIIGKCCRDPNYKDPWPAGMMMNTGHDDGQYHDHSHQGTTTDTCGPSATCTAAYECSGDRRVQPTKDCRVPLDGSTGVCCSPAPLFPTGTNNQQVNTEASNFFPSTSPLTPTQQYYTPAPISSNNPFLPENYGKFPIPEEPKRKPTPFPNQIPQVENKNDDEYGKQSTPTPSFKPRPQPGYPQPTPRPKPGGYPQPTQRPRPGGYPQPSQPQPQPSIPQPTVTPKPTYTEQRPQPNFPQPSYKPQPTYQQPQPQPTPRPQPATYPTTASTTTTTTTTTTPAPTEATTQYQAPTTSRNTYANLPSYSQIKPEIKEPEPQSQTPKPEVIYTPQPFPISENNYPENENPSQELEPENPVVRIPQSKPTRPKGPSGGYPSPDKKATQPPPLIRPTPLPLNTPAPGKQCGARRDVPRPNGPAGLETGFGEFPWQAQVLTEKNQNAICGGAILSENIIVTAAHCLEGLTSRDLLVKVGDWKLRTENPSEEPKPMQLRYVDALVRHPSYDPVSQFNDMAVLSLAEPLILDSHIDTLCIGDAVGLGQRPRGNNCVITGWGKDAVKSNIPGSTLNSIPVNFIDSQQCEEKLKQVPHLGRNFQLNRSFACAEPINPSQDLCKVDVGSPIACQKADGHYELSGVYSWDTGCHQNANLPAASSNVDVKWVKTCVKKTAAQLRQDEADLITRNQNLGRDPSVSDLNKPGFSQGYGK